MSDKLGSIRRIIMLFTFKKNSNFPCAIGIQISADALSVSRKNCFGLIAARGESVYWPVAWQ
jgi:hypothetical protein